MRKPLRMSVICAVAFGLASAGASRAAAQEVQTTTQFWPEGNAYVRLSKATRLFFLLAPVRDQVAETGALSKISDIQFGAHLDIGLLPFGRGARLASRYDADRLSYLRLRLGLRYQTRPNDEPPQYKEWRGIVELTPRFLLPGQVIVAERNRLDLRWVNGDRSWRYRPRIWVERETHLGPHVTLVPYGSAEVFWDSRYDEWVRARYQLGAAVPVTRWLAPELYVAYQRDEQPTLSYTRALGIVVAMYF